MVIAVHIESKAKLYLNPSVFRHRQTTEKIKENCPNKTNRSSDKVHQTDIHFKNRVFALNKP
jgi:hypothetical protein